MILLAAGTARENQAALIEERHDGAVGQREIIEHVLQLNQVETQGQHADDGAIVCARPGTPDRLSAGRSEARQSAR